jgi:hypothetical protein
MSSRGDSVRGISIDPSDRPSHSIVMANVAHDLPAQIADRAEDAAHDQVPFDLSGAGLGWVARSQSSSAYPVREGSRRAWSRASFNRAWRFAGVGAEVIREALHRHNVAPLPSISTIERVLRRHGYPRRPSRPPVRPTESYPAPRAMRPGDLDQNDLVGPRYLRGPPRRRSVLRPGHRGRRGLWRGPLGRPSQNGPGPLLALCAGVAGSGDSPDLPVR